MSSTLAENYPLLANVIAAHVEYYKTSGEYVSRHHIVSDLRKDSQFDAMVEEAGVRREHRNALATFRRVAWDVTKRYMNSRTGWNARRYGVNSEFFHEDWGTPEDFRDNINLRLKDKERDQEAIDRMVAITETRCGQLGWVFDPQLDEAGSLVRVEVWQAVAA